MSIKKANTLNEIYDAVLIKPLAMDELDAFYCDTDAVRAKTSARFKLKDRIVSSSQSSRNDHILFVGYTGCGKSTELNYLQKELQQEDYTVLNYSVFKELDPISIHYIELFIVTMERLFQLAKDENLTISKSFLDKIVGWTQSKEIENIKNTHLSLEVESGMELQTPLPYLLNFFLKLKGAAKSSQSFKESIKQNIEPRLSSLVEHCNGLIAEVRLQLASKGKKDILIFIEDLDKIPLDRAESLFFNYGMQLIQLNAIIVYTFPVYLYYNTRFAKIKNHFPGTIELPMIKISTKDGADYDNGISVMKKIMLTRINGILFAPGVPEMFIKMTGGVIRDLFAMLYSASVAAMYRNSSLINEEDFIISRNELRKEYDATIANYHDNKENLHITTKEFYEAMRDLLRDPERRPENTDTMMLLRKNLCVLSYNGEGWCDVHPVMKQVLKDRNYI